MSTMLLTQVYLEPKQKEALQKRARAKGTKLAEEIRNAVDAYLAGVSADELALLDAATREAERHLDAMAADLKQLNAKVDRTLVQIDRLRAESPVARYEAKA
jgi:outer membrane murein-binding lipoprotein Lpp